MDNLGSYSSSSPGAEHAAEGHVPLVSDAGEVQPDSTPQTAPPDGKAQDSKRLVRLLTLLVLLVLFAIPFTASPYLVGQFRYHWLKAEVNVATEGLSEIKPRLNDLELASRLVAKRVSPSVVSIHRPDVRGGEGQGSGVIVDDEGYIATNFHVVAGATGLHVRLYDGRTYDATIVGADMQTDMAILNVEADDLIAAQWGDSNELEIGDLVWALGSPFGLESSITFGIVSAKERRSSTGFTGSPYQEYLQTDVAVNPGNSGGPLVNINGEIVGINTAILGRSYRGVSFAIPSALAQAKYDQLREKGWIERGFLGIQPVAVSPSAQKQYDLRRGEGVWIDKVTPDGPAAKAGLRDGDIILAWNEHRATDPTLLSREIASTGIGSTAKVKVKRMEQGQLVEMQLDVEVGRHPVSVRPPR